MLNYFFYVAKLFGTYVSESNHKSAHTSDSNWSALCDVADRDDRQLNSNSVGDSNIEINVENKSRSSDGQAINVILNNMVNEDNSKSKKPRTS